MTFFEACLVANAKANERESFYGYMAVGITLVTIVAVIVGICGIIFKDVKALNVAYIMSWCCFGANILRVIVRNIEWHGFLRGLIPCAIFIAVFVTAMLLLALIKPANSFVYDRFITVATEEVAKKAVWQYAIGLANVASLIVSRFI